LNVLWLALNPLLECRELVPQHIHAVYSPTTCGPNRGNTPIVCPKAAAASAASATTAESNGLLPSSPLLHRALETVLRLVVVGGGRVGVVGVCVVSVWRWGSVTAVVDVVVRTVR
jgi:hypothetical protein